MAAGTYFSSFIGSFKKLPISPWQLAFAFAAIALAITSMFMQNPILPSLLSMLSVAAFIWHSSPAAHQTTMLASPLSKYISAIQDMATIPLRPIPTSKMLYPEQENKCGK